MAVGRRQSVAVLATALGILSIMDTVSVCLWVIYAMCSGFASLHADTFVSVPPPSPLSDGLRFELCWPARRQDGQVPEQIAASGPCFA